MLLASACGARTTLDLDDTPVFTPLGSGGSGGGGAGGQGGNPGAGQGGAGVGGAGGGSGIGGSLAGIGGEPDGGVDGDAGPDVVITDAGCKSDEVCDDQVPCTLDVCDLALGVCTHTPQDSLCDDGLFCTGKETCNPTKGCVVTPVNCNDGVGCTVDACDEAGQGCTHTPDDALCPLSHKCGEKEGCYALAYAHSPEALYEIRLPSGKVTQIGTTGTQLTDIALVSNTQLLGLSYTSLFDVSTTTGDATFIASTNTSGMVAFDVAPDGQLFVGGGSTLFLLDANSGQIQPAAQYPQGWQASGDLAFLQGRLLATSRSGNNGTDSLTEFDLPTGQSKNLGSVGFTCVWGLAAFGETLYGLTCNGEVLNIDPNTGAAKLLSSNGPAFWGASAR